MLCLLPTLALGLQVAAPVRHVAGAAQPRAAVQLVLNDPSQPGYDAASDPDIPDEPTLGEWFNNMPFAMSKSLARQTLLSGTKEPEPLPPIWDWFWDTMPFLRAGKEGEPLGLGDVARTFKVNIEQIFGSIPAPDKAPLAAADVEGLDFKALFLGMKTYFDKYGSLFKMCFGPKSFMVVNDPAIARHILRENSRGYDKGALALVLEDIMGKGLIPADPETWAKRRRAIAPGFHKLYLARMVDEFGQANANLIPQLLKAAESNQRLDMEERFGSLALDVIGKAVFNYDFGSVQEESPVVKAAIRTLGEVEHRALTPAPYWKIPGANKVVPRLVEFNEDMDLLNGVLYKLIDQCLENREPLELEALKAKDYSKVKDPSMLRFLVDLRGEEVDNTQMRDDLITLLIAGHETTAAVLTWLMYALSQHPEALKTLQAEIDEKVGDRYPTVDDVRNMPEVQKAIAETLRMWPAPPLLIRCAVEADTWPEGGTNIEGGAEISRANVSATQRRRASCRRPASPRLCRPARQTRHLARRTCHRCAEAAPAPRPDAGPLHLDVQHGPLSAALGRPGRLRPTAVGQAVHQPRRQGLGGVRSIQARHAGAVGRQPRDRDGPRAAALWSGRAQVRRRP